MVLYMTYRILHISDLHRSPDYPIDNNTLIASLDRDFQRHGREDPPIGPIDSVVVSGDLVQGVPLGETGFEKVLDDQYRVAYDFLSDISDRYLGGDRSRLVIVPGNHDVDWNAAHASMREVPDAEQDVDLRRYLNATNTNYRFCWRTRKLFEIVDDGLYERRLENFRSFFRQFYESYDGLWRLDPLDHCNIFSLCDGRLVVAAFNSCHRNDLYQPIGSIKDGAIGQAALKITEANKEFDLKIAVWHHSIHGAPEQIDYMDVDRVFEMVNHGFRLGLHGHQHKTSVFPQHIKSPSDATMFVVSAGSLCVGARELPYGERRQYNIIEIAEDFRSVTVHVRQMGDGHAFGPRLVEDFGGNSYIKFELDPELTLVGTQRDPITERNRTMVMEAERALGARNFEDAISFLTPLDAEPTGHARRLLLQAFENSARFSEIIDRFVPPQSADELVAVVNASIKGRQFDTASTILHEYGGTVGMAQPQLEELRQLIAAEQEISA